VFVASTCVALAWPALAAPPKPKPVPPAASTPPPVPTVAGPKPLAETLPADAKADYDAAKVAYGDKDYANASLKFKAAYDKSKDPRLLWNVANCEKQLRHYAKVRALLKRYLAEGGELINEKDRADADEVLKAIDPFIASITIHVNEPGAEVYVEDELVGTSPLPGTVDVDLGSRKVRVKKAGFKEETTTIAVGGDKPVTVEVKIVVEVHEGKLTVKAPEGASIVLDGQSKGTTTWTGMVSGGGHTLRVSAAGRTTYQAEVSVQEGGERTIDVVLDPLAAPVAPKDDSPGFELGLRTVYGFVTGNDKPGLGMVGIDAGYRLGWPTYLGLYAQYGKMVARGTCGMAYTGPEPAGLFDFSERNSFSDCTVLKGGIPFILHFLPRGRFDPFFGIDVGVLYVRASARRFDPLGGTTSDKKLNGAAIQAGAQLGVEIHPIASVRSFTMSPYIAFGMSVIGGYGFNGDNGGSEERSEKHPFSNLLFGLRTAIGL